MVWFGHLAVSLFVIARATDSRLRTAQSLARQKASPKAPQPFNHYEEVRVKKTTSWRTGSLSSRRAKAKKDLAKNTYIIDYLGIICLGGLVILGLALLAPNNQPSRASALECTSDNAEACIGKSDPVASAVDVLIRPAIAVSIQSNVQMDITPELTGAWFTNETAELTVSTNSDSGYSVYMSTVDGSGDLHSANLNDSSAITSITTDLPAADFGANTWGYRVVSAENALYSPIPTTVDTAIVSAETSSAEMTRDTYNIDFGVSVDNSLPSGQYHNSLIFSAVANPITVSSLYDLAYMQDMTTEICDNTVLHATKQLIDTRDGKSYWISKLKDGHCWMTQNLGLDLEAGKPLTNADSHVATAYTPTSSTNSVAITTGMSTAVSNQWSWDFGKLMLATPAYGTSCGNITTTLPGDTLTTQIVQKCGKVGVVDVSDSNKFKATYQAAEGQSWTFTDNQVVDNTLVAVNCTEWTDDENLGHICTAGTYDTHYLLGNYYQWQAATAGTAASTADEGVVPSSICPKGWHLPGGGDSGLTTVGAWAYMLKQYGFVTNAAINSSAGNTVRATVGGEDYYALGFPTYFNISGAIDARFGFANLAHNTSYWTSRHAYYVDKPSQMDIARTLLISADVIIPNSAPSSASIGNQIRCISL